MSGDRTSCRPPRDESSISGFHDSRRPTDRVRRRRNRNRNSHLQFASRCNLTVYDLTSTISRKCGSHFLDFTHVDISYVYSSAIRTRDKQLPRFSGDIEQMGRIGLVFRIVSERLRGNAFRFAIL